QNLKERTDLQANFTKMLDEFGDLNKKLGDLTKKGEYDREGDQKKYKKLANEYDQVRKQLIKVQEAQKPPDLLKYDTPKGAVVRLDPKGEVAWINIGSADNLR